jgi:hypothetical protein
MGSVGRFSPELVSRVAHCPVSGLRFRYNHLILKWLPLRDSNPDMLSQSQLSYH